ncbi:hypothetical protein ASG43_05180 [Aureimonas sp. Leaf454]|uniref:GumC family protein n=1 Tax=Aureimonas sp. Leaf454 TaxID=1736381 RepID=UPI0006FAD112|nr:exopolysaccharide transport family protein [Aureimonas sp. Leaf454]KQT50681.1 hypothetical protein ASG43_05180 [Aureimonas sp. Leaf454]
MNSAPPREFARLTPPAQDFRPRYEATISSVLRLFWRRKVWIATILAFVMAGAVGAASMMPKSYVGEALIQLTFDGGGAPGEGQAGTGAASTSVDATSIVEGEAEIIRSRAIARRVASDLAARELARSGTEAPSPATPAATGAATGAEAPKNPVLAFFRDVANGLRHSVSAAPIPAFDRSVLDLQSRLSVRNEGKSYLIRIAFTSNDPARAATIANAFAETYLQSRVEVSVGSARRTSDWLASQVEAAKLAVAEADQRIAKARLAGVGGSAGNVQATEKQLGDLVTQLSSVRLDRLNLEARLSRLRSAAADGHTPSASDLAGSTDAPRLIEAEVAKRQEASRLASTLGSRHPLVARADKALQDARDQLTAAIASAISTTEADVASASASEATLAERLDAAKRSALDSQTASKRLGQLETEAEAARGALVRLQESYRQALALADLKPIGAKLVSPAETLAVPASPKLSLVAVLSGILGLGAGLGTVLLLELRDTGFRSAPQIAVELGARCLGIIPAIDTHDISGTRQLREEALKALAIKAGLTHNRNGGTIVVVTSAAPREGKTELVRDLAQTLASMDRRVLTIENAIRPSAGGSEWDGQSDADAEESHRTALTMRVHNAGTKIAGYYRASDDLRDVFGSHDHMRSWLEENSSHFDIVIVETPPILTKSDALVMTWLADLVLLAVKWNDTPKAAVSSAYSQLNWTKGETGIVLNQVDVARHKALGTKDSLYFHRRYLGRRAKEASRRGFQHGLNA